MAKAKAEKETAKRTRRTWQTRSGDSVTVDPKTGKVVSINGAAVKPESEERKEDNAE